MGDKPLKGKYDAIWEKTLKNLKKIKTDLCKKPPEDLEKSVEELSICLKEFHAHSRAAPILPEEPMYGDLKSAIAEVEMALHAAVASCKSGDR
ncbi:MAG: hypothetical protein HOI80_04055 [Alphaproteobacteria bacterium]|jgi:hypothetical protein|nr:hypothetical protein [Alphaproteobacteria bacterium]MBT5390345.1 hypothetical protein [Alphaproteobacteria bacterium]MBT5539972.1 hypothetical protein [Alphaproteobacteria bacterium]MBT5654659.1 hypothetical protein [Alphaproteobacteria bacterium]